jgi:hypothetical protein
MNGRMNNLLPYELSKEGKKKKNKGNNLESFYDNMSFTLPCI